MAQNHYRQLQQAWNVNDLAEMQGYLALIFQQLKTERASLHGDQHTEVMFVDAELARADYSSRVAELSIRFSGKYRDTVEGIEEPITDIWHLQRDLTQPNAPWLIVGIEARPSLSDNVCSNYDMMLRSHSLSLTSDGEAFLSSSHDKEVVYGKL